METIQCRGCRTEIEASATMCPLCLRPRNRLEITRDFASLRENKKKLKRRPFVIAAWAIGLGAAGWIGFRFQEPLIAAVSSAAAAARAKITGAADAAMDPKHLTSTPDEPSAAAAPAVAVPTALPAETPAKAAAPAPAASAAAAVPLQEKPASRGPVEDLPIPSMDSSSQWAVYGRVYDLITLKPVAGAEINFRGNGAGMGSAQTDADGRYVVTLPRLSQGGYELHASHPAYAPSALYEGDIPYAHLSLQERRGIVSNAQDGDMTLPTLNDVSGEASLRRDVFLAPKR